MIMYYYNFQVNSEPLIVFFPSVTGQHKEAIGGATFMHSLQFPCSEQLSCNAHNSAIESVLRVSYSAQEYNIVLSDPLNY